MPDNKKSAVLKKLQDYVSFCKTNINLNNRQNYKKRNFYFIKQAEQANRKINQLNKQ